MNTQNGDQGGLTSEAARIAGWNNMCEQVRRGGLVSRSLPAHVQTWEDACAHVRGEMPPSTLERDITQMRRTLAAMPDPWGRND